MMQPKTRYARNAEGHVAYQVCGEGALDIVLIPDWCTNLEIMWEEPSLARFLQRLASLGRLICFDKRGTGVSDPVPLGAMPTFERWMDDVRTVMDAVGSQCAALLGHGDGGPMAMLFAATYPDRTAALVLLDCYARRLRAADYPSGVPLPVAVRMVRAMLADWGSGESARIGAPSMAGDGRFREWRGRYERLSMSPAAFEAMYPLTLETDLRPILPTIRVPTLVLHRAGNRYVRPGNGRYLAEHIAGARYIELPGADHFFHTGDSEALLGVVQELLTGAKSSVADDRVLATVLFTDIVDATGHATRLGDRGWRELLERHHAIVRRQLEQFRGREMDTAGDGFFATFDGPARGVRCALAIRDALRGIGLEIRAGLHTGECERVEDKIGGIAVHIGSRVAAGAAPGEVLVSSTLKDLVAGAGLQFIERGSRPLKGVAGEWLLYAAA